MIAYQKMLLFSAVRGQVVLIIRTQFILAVVKVILLLFVDATLNYFFTMGGGDTATFIAIDECNRYDVSTNTWLPRAPLPAARDRFATALVGDFIYAIGGY